MRNPITLAKTLKLGAALLALASGVHAQNGEWITNPNTPNEWRRFSYVDFGTTTIAGHAGHPTNTFSGVAGLKYKFLQIDNGNTINNQQCFEVRTSAPRFMPGVVSDTRIWIISHLGSLAVPRGLNDDIGGTRYSAARVWLKGAPSSFVNLAVAAFNAQWNTIHFSLDVAQLPLTEAACTTGQVLPWVKVINGTMTVSPNAF